MADDTINTFNYQKIPDNYRDQLFDMMNNANYTGSGRGSHQNILQNLLSKHDRFGLAQVQINADMVGLTFFTKPRLNMTTSNIRQDRILAMLDSHDPLDWMFSLRCNLDSVYSRRSDVAKFAAASPYFNDESPFNVPLSNALVGISGWPDFVIESKTSDPGIFSEDMTMARGSDWGRRTYPLSCTFRDVQGGYIMAYFYYWLVAMTLQMEGRTIAYPDDREFIRMNYTCSIYRLTLDPELRRITKWVKATGCYPTSVPLGDVFNFGPGDSFIHTSQQFTVNFVANNIRYMDPIHLEAFNVLVNRYAGGDVTKGRVALGPESANNFMGLPYIDLYSGKNLINFYAKPEEVSAANYDADINSIIANIKNAVQTGPINSTSLTARNNISI